MMRFYIQNPLGLYKSTIKKEKEKYASFLINFVPSFAQNSIYEEYFSLWIFFGLHLAMPLKNILNLVMCPNSVWMFIG